MPFNLQRIVFQTLYQLTQCLREGSTGDKGRFSSTSVKENTLNVWGLLEIDLSLGCLFDNSHQHQMESFKASVFELDSPHLKFLPGKQGLVM